MLSVRDQLFDHHLKGQPTRSPSSLYRLEIVCMLRKMSFYRLQVLAAMFTSEKVSLILKPGYLSIGLLLDQFYSVIIRSVC